jgi:hypothetical protein
MQVALQPPQQRQPEQEAVEAEPQILLAQGPAEHEDHQQQTREQRPPPIGQEVDRPDHHPRQKRQLLPHILELLHDLGHDVNHQREHHERGHEAQHDRVSQRAQHLAAHLRLPLQQVRQPVQDARQSPRSLARRNHRAVERREAAALAPHRVAKVRPSSTSRCTVPRMRRTSSRSDWRDTVRSASSSGLTWMSVASWRVNRVSCLVASLRRRSSPRDSKGAPPFASAPPDTAGSTLTT